MTRPVFWLWVIMLSGCTTDLSVKIGRPPPTSCPEYRPPAREAAPPSLDLDLLPFEDAESVAFILGTENKSLRDYIRRRDEADTKSYTEYLQSCHPAGKTVRPSLN